jgi:2'-hydroxyisoflavone reductase
MPCGSRLHLLVLGGTGFVGQATIAAALARGHAVAMFNRGLTERRYQQLGQALPFTARVETIAGNRDPDRRAIDGDPESPRGLARLEGREFDAVIDTSGYFPRMVRASAELLASRCAQYVFVSSISRYVATSTPGADEATAAAPIADPANETLGEHGEQYGPLKALCEATVAAAFPGRATIVRPGYIVGPGDAMPFFTYWPVRLARACGDSREVLVPGRPDDPVQFIDVRDLAEWLVTVVETRTVGAFNVCGPEERLSAGALLSACRTAAGTDPLLTYVPAQRVGPDELALRLLSAREGERGVYHEWSNARAVTAGLTFRPVVQTCADTLAWFNDSPEYRRRSLSKRFLSPSREADMLKAWQAAGPVAV